MEREGLGGWVGSWVEWRNNGQPLVIEGGQPATATGRAHHNTSHHNTTQHNTMLERMGSHQLFEISPPILQIPMPHDFWSIAVERLWVVSCGTTFISQSLQECWSVWFVFASQFSCMTAICCVHEFPVSTFFLVWSVFCV